MVTCNSPPILFPDNLLQSTEHTTDCRWWVLMTKAQHEKCVARRLYEWQIPYFLPLMRRSTRCGGRTITSAMPLIPGCVFLFGTAQDRRVSQQTAEVLRVAAVRNRHGMFHDFRQLHRLITSDAPLTVERQLALGRRVRVRQGVLAGVEGTVFQRQGESRLLVGVRSLDRGASVAVDGFVVENLDLL